MLPLDVAGGELIAPCRDGSGQLLEDTSYGVYKMEGLTVIVTSDLIPLKLQRSLEPMVIGPVPTGVTERMRASPILEKLAKSRNYG